MVKKAVIYERSAVVPDEKVIKRLAKNIEYAEMLDYLLIGAFVEYGSGLDSARPLLKHVLEMDKKKEFDILITTESTRLSRDQAHYLKIEQGLQADLVFTIWDYHQVKILKEKRNG
jgi:DNA invertase Pin-like site-specific DNA recombinase